LFLSIGSAYGLSLSIGAAAGFNGDGCPSGFPGLTPLRA